LWEEGGGNVAEKTGGHQRLFTTALPRYAPAVPRSFKKVLVANRGEIAVRVIRTLHEMGMGAVAVYSEADRAALHVRRSDEAFCIGPPAAAESYLRVDKIVDVAKKAGCDAIHPGYGFLSENPLLPEACTAAGIVFIGPPASAMRAMGSKTAARAKMSAAGVPIVPGASCETAEEAVAAAKKIGFPVMLKAASGGGGKGMRLVERAEDMANAWERARSEAKKFFGDDTVYLEKALIRPRHVEIQVLGDQAGHLVHVFERDCSIQRRNQKVVEETPSPAASRDLVHRMGSIAVKGAEAVGYFSAGTFEFLLAEDGTFYFLEMNTRLQVEHPVTELVSGLDLVREMVRVAQGETLGFAQDDLSARGAAIECRVYAEDPSNGFLPSPGKIDSLETPSGPGVRDDGGAYPGCVISSYYDPLISKLSVWAPTRARAIGRMQRALSEYVVTGIRTNLAFHEKLFVHPEFVAGHYDTGFLEREKNALLGYARIPPDHREAVAVAVAIAAARMERASGVASAAEGETGSRLSPWIAQHRARLLR
jgi:acetyl-CoA carboxylase, biotin carboxylase subunit